MGILDFSHLWRTSTLFWSYWGWTQFERFTSSGKCARGMGIRGSSLQRRKCWWMMLSQPFLSPAVWEIMKTSSKSPSPLLVAQPHGSTRLYTNSAQHTQPSRGLTLLPGMWKVDHTFQALPQINWSVACRRQLWNSPAPLLVAEPHGGAPLPGMLGPAKNPPLVTCRQRTALLTVNPSRSASHHTKGMQKWAVGISHCWQTGREAGPTYSTPVVTGTQPQKWTRHWWSESWASGEVPPQMIVWTLKG